MIIQPIKMPLKAEPASKHPVLMCVCVYVCVYERDRNMKYCLYQSSLVAITFGEDIAICTHNVMCLAFVCLCTTSMSSLSSP